MQLLASALPGFRDLRAPLTAGYFWLLFLWIFFKPHLTTRPTNEIAGAMYDLGKGAGPIWIGLAVGIGAFLIGSVSQSLSSSLDALTALIVYQIKHFSLTRQEVFQSEFDSDFEIPSSIDNEQIARLYRRVVRENRGSVDVRQPRERERFFRDVRMRAIEAQRGLDIELAMPATLLIGKEQELFSEADRLKAESQLRFSVIPPLLAISIYLACSQSLWWLLCGIALAVLTWQGHSKNNEFRTLMLGAVQRGLIQSQSIQDFENWVTSSAWENQESYRPFVIDPTKAPQD